MSFHILPFDPKAKIRLMFQDEAGFGRINKPKRCWCRKGLRPCVPCHHIREYRYAFGAVEPKEGEHFFLVMPNCNTECMNIFLRELSKEYSKDYILLAVDGASWHRSKSLEIPDNIYMIYIPPYTPEMNPIEQIWDHLREVGFKNEIFPSLQAVMNRLCEVIYQLKKSTVRSITARKWILSSC